MKISKYTKQMNRNAFVWSCFVMTFFSACQQEEHEMSQANEWQMSIVASIKGQKNALDSRYAGDDPSNVVFEETDRIGVFIDDDSALEWTYGESGWSANQTVYWPDKTKDHTFCAFYPYAEASSTANVPMPSLMSQTGTMESISACDFLVATVTQSYGEDGVVNFQEENAFTHVSSLLQLTFKGDNDLSSSILKKISVNGEGILAPATYSFTTKEVTLTPDESSDLLEVDLNHEMGGNDATFYFILNEKLDASSIVTLTVEYETGGKTYVAQLENLAGNVLTGGMRHRYTFNIKDSSLIIVGSSITSWEEGGQLEEIIINGTEQSV